MLQPLASVLLEPGGHGFGSQLVAQLSIDADVGRTTYFEWFREQLKFSL